MKPPKYTEYLVIVLVSAIFCFALVLRLIPLRSNTPFWVDEFSTGTSARIILQQGLKIFLDKPPGFESNNSLTYALTAGSFVLFGQSESAARVPSVIFGSLVVIAVYLLGRKLHSTTAGILASLFTATSYFQIVWSVQARSYMLLQLLTLLTIWWSVKMVEKPDTKLKDLIVLACLFILGMTTHFMFALCVLSVILVIIVSHRHKVIPYAISRWYILISIVVLAIVALWQTGFINSLIAYANSSFLLANNLWYYHPFLWREYGLVVFTGVLGLVMMGRSASKSLGIITLHLVLQLIFVTFFFGHHMSKYLLPIFPYFFIGMGIFLYEVSKVLVGNTGKIKLLKKYTLSTRVLTVAIASGLSLFIIANGHKFVLKPKAYYSLNHDFREISNIDYNQVYAIVKEKLAINSTEKVAMVDTWGGRTYWYLGEAYTPFYLLRWEDEEGFENGHLKKTAFQVDSNGEKYLTDTIGFVSEAKDIKKVMSRYSKGFLFVDDDTLPRSVIDFAEKNLKKEIVLDHYPLDDNPYSIWPATLYSWGFDK